MTNSRFSFGISSPTNDLPGITSTTRTLTTDSERARSFARLEIWLTLTPGAGSSSNRVIIGPGETDFTSTSTPKSLSFNSTSRDIASSDSGEYPCRCSGGSSSSESGGNSPTAGGSKSGTWRSRSARTLGSKAGITGSIRGLLRPATRFFSTSIMSCRAAALRRPSARSRNSPILTRAFSNATRQKWPIRSMTANQEMPRNTDSEATQTTNNSVLAPSSFINDSSQWPTIWPIMPPAVSLKPMGEKCSVDKAQLVTSVARKPPKRKA